jgi:hypothetical protein
MLMLQLASRAEKAINLAKKLASSGSSQDDAKAAVLKELADWSPQVNGRGILTGALRVKLAGALVHLGYNIIAAERGKDPS